MSKKQSRFMQHIARQGNSKGLAFDPSGKKKKKHSLGKATRAPTAKIDASVVARKAREWEAYLSQCKEQNVTPPKVPDDVLRYWQQASEGNLDSPSPRTRKPVRQSHLHSQSDAYYRGTRIKFTHEAMVREFQKYMEGERAVLEEQTGFDCTDVKDQREWRQTEAVARYDQVGFRKRVLEAYDFRCAITGCNVEAALQACHIYPYKGGNTDCVQNGILLRADLHILFDRFYFCINSSDYSIVVSKAILNRIHGIPSGCRLQVPVKTWHGPSKVALDWHKSQMERLERQAYGPSDIDKKVE